MTKIPYCKEIYKEIRAKSVMDVYWLTPAVFFEKPSYTS
jgi:hypothetical protein